MSDLVYASQLKAAAYDEADYVWICRDRTERPSPVLYAARHLPPSHFFIEEIGGDWEQGQHNDRCGWVRLVREIGDTE